MTDEIKAFVEAVERNEFDCLFFTSALPAKIIAPLLNRIPRIIAIGPQTAKELQQSEIDCETLTSFYSRDFVPYLGEWIRGKHIGIPRADVPNPALIDAINPQEGSLTNSGVTDWNQRENPLTLKRAEAILFTSAMSFTKAVWTRNPELVVIAIGEITADAMQKSRSQIPMLSVMVHLRDH